MTRARALRRWLAAALALGFAHALELSVDPAGGALTLEQEVTAALADWRAAGVDPDALDAQVSVRYGPAARFGPDVVAWVVVRESSDDEGRRYEILVAPDAAAPRSALVPALGVVLGGALGEGALDPILDPAGPRRPDEDDGRALRERRDALPGDLNRDGRIDFADLLLLAEAYGRRGVNLPGDLDGDGVVGEADLTLLREAYAFDPPTTED